MDIAKSIDPNFRGVVYVVQNHQTVCEKITGFADLPNEIPNILDTKFASASAGKVFVAVGILQLIDRNLLSLQDTIGNLLDIDLHHIDPDITIQQLLNHTSGVPDYFDETILEDYEQLWVDFPNYKIRRNKDLLPLFIDKPMLYPKGEKFQYNNSGYVILAMIIEKITGMFFDEYIKKYIFDACNMTSSGYYSLDQLPAKCASHYIYCHDTNCYRTNIYSVDAKGTGAGGAFITAKDIVNFWDALINKKLLSDELTAEMLKIQSGDGMSIEEGYYGYGVWMIKTSKHQDIAYFQGCDPGVSFISEYNPNHNIISVLISNYGDNVWSEMRKIRTLLYND
jgi:CubicO group peptidase (beta-lactamase class C family)